MGKKNLFIFKISNLILLAILMSLLPHPANAETKIFVKEYTYQASEDDSRNSSRTIALREVKKLLLEELGTYLESQTEVKNFQMTKDQITTLTAGIVSAEIIEDKWDGKVYWLKAKISANPQDVIKSIDSLRKDRDKVKELEELRKKSEELLKENERLSKELKIAKGETKQETVQAYKRNIDNLSATEWFERGYELAISSNYTDAVKAFSKAIELNPQDAMAYYNRGFAYVSLGNDQQAIKDYSKAIELNLEYAEVYLGRGVAYVSFGNYQQAIKDCSKAIELNPQLAEPYHIRGLVYVGLGNNQQAIKDFSKAIELEPQFAKVYYIRGLAYDILGNGQQSIKDIKIAARLGHKKSQDFLKSKGISW